MMIMALMLFGLWLYSIPLRDGTKLSPSMDYPPLKARPTPEQKAENERIAKAHGVHQTNR